MILLKSIFLFSYYQLSTIGNNTVINKILIDTTVEGVHVQTNLKIIGISLNSFNKFLYYQNFLLQNSTRKNYAVF